MKPFDVVAAIFEDSGRVLLQYRTNTANYSEHWGLPAGRIEADESVQEAINREIKEELNVAITINDGPDYHCTLDGGRRFAAFIVSTYHSTITNNEPNLCKELAWHDLGRLPSPLTPATQRLLELHQEDA